MIRNILFPVVAISFLLLGCKSSKKATLAEDNIKEYLTYLASDELEGRKTGTQGIEKAAVYIEDVFKKSKLKPYYQTYRDSFSFIGKTGYNLIAFQEGTDRKLKDEIIILGAHYDHIGRIREAIGSDDIANGANDNASGTAAVLALADYFAKQPTKRSLMFVLFSAEEEGLLGAKHLAQRLKNEKANIYFVLNYEMIGVPLPHNVYAAYLTGYEKSTMAKEFNMGKEKPLFGFFEKEKSFQLFYRSDNFPFYEALNIPSQTLCTFDFSNYQYYHHVKDELDQLDIKHIQNLVQATIKQLTRIGNASERLIKLH